MTPKVRPLARSFGKTTNGNIAVITALSMTILVGSAGIALVMVEGNRHETILQAGLDAGVLAGTALGFGTSDGDRVAAAEKAFYANVTVGEFGDGGPDGVEFSAEEVPKPAFTVTNARVSGTAKSTVKPGIAATLGIAKLDVASVAQAEKMASDPVCVLALNTKNPDSIYVYGNAQLNVDGCAVQANSADGAGLNMTGNASSAKALQFGVTGSFGGENWSPQPITGTEPVSDPYASLPVPPSGPCVNAASKLQRSSFTLSPGTYCGGLNIKAGAQVTLEPGIYIIQDGQLAINSGAVVTGQEVVIALVGANAFLDMKSDATLKVTSPISGTYKNIQLMSDRDLSQSKFEEEWTTILSGAKFEFDGVIYIPEQQLWVSGTAHEAVIKGSSPSMILVVDTVWAQGNAVFDLKNEDKRGTGGDGVAAAFAYGARLVK
jgi:hypothetical protein